jgi:hypothetical protein
MTGWKPARRRRAARDEGKERRRARLRAKRRRAPVPLRMPREPSRRSNAG